MNSDRFDGFPASASATAIPNLFFSRVLPGLRSSDALLAFLWLHRAIQQCRGAVRCATAEEIWALDGAAGSFEALGSGRVGLDAGLRECVEARALLAVHLTGAGGESVHYFVNSPGSRRAIARVRAGELKLRESAVVVDDAAARAAPRIFRLYEQYVGTISPFVANRLMETAARYPPEWVEDAVEQAAPDHPRNWRRVENILERWLNEGRVHEANRRDSRAHWQARPGRGQQRTTAPD